MWDACGAVGWGVGHHVTRRDTCPLLCFQPSARVVLEKAGLSRWLKNVVGGRWGKVSTLVAG